jgi:hypothetical protein
VLLVAELVFLVDVAAYCFATSYDTLQSPGALCSQSISVLSSHVYHFDYSSTGS